MHLWLNRTMKRDHLQLLYKNTLNSERLIECKDDCLPLKCLAQAEVSGFDPQPFILLLKASLSPRVPAVDTHINYFSVFLFVHILSLSYTFISLSLHFFISVSFSISHSLYLCLFPSPFLPLFLSLFPSISPSLCVSFSLSIPPISLSFFLSFFTLKLSWSHNFTLAQSTNVCPCVAKQPYSTTHKFSFLFSIFFCFLL